jgi:hypothetical protein
MSEIILIVSLLEESMSVQILKEQLIFADKVNKSSAFAYQEAFHCLFIDFFELLLGDLKGIDENIGKDFAENTSQKDEIIYSSHDVLFEKVAAYFNPELVLASNTKESSSFLDFSPKNKKKGTFQRRQYYCCSLHLSQSTP